MSELDLDEINWFWLKNHHKDTLKVPEFMVDRRWNVQSSLSVEMKLLLWSRSFESDFLTYEPTDSSDSVSSGNHDDGRNRRTEARSSLTAALVRLCSLGGPPHSPSPDPHTSDSSEQVFMVISDLLTGPGSPWPLRTANSCRPETFCLVWLEPSRPEPEPDLFGSWGTLHQAHLF